jgi:capsular exopolysaccharide synthesis family protein
MKAQFNSPEGLVERAPADTLTIQDMVGFLRRRKTVILATACILLMATLMWCIFGTKMFCATGQIQIQKENSDAFGLEGALSGAADSASDALDYNVTLETQANILRSDTLALQVARELNLEGSEDFSPKSHLQIPHWLTPWSLKREQESVALDQAPVRRYKLLKRFSDRLSVETVSGTRLITITYTNPDPKLAAEVVNALIRDFQEYTFQTRYTVTVQASGWLSGQIADLKKDTEALQAKAIVLQRDTGMFGDNQDHNIILAKLEEMNVAAGAAEGNRILKEAIFHAVESGNPELVSNLAGNAPVTAAGIAAMPNSLSLVQSLRLQEAALRSELADDESRYGPAYPKIAALKSQIEDVNIQMHEELQRVSSRAKSDYQIALEAEQQARQGFEAQKKVALETNDKAIQFALAKQEADDSRDLYEDMLKKLKEAGVLEGLRSTNITVVDQGRIPARPSRPYAPVYLPASLGAGLMLGLILAIFIDLTDNRIHAIEEIEHTTHKPVLAVLPQYTLAIGRTPLKPGSIFARNKDKGRLVAPIATAEPNSFYVEAVRSLRTSLMLSRSALPPQVIKVSSPLAGEGKSTLVMNLGAILAQQGARVLLVDADLRRPQLHIMAGASQEPGLSSLLSTTSESKTALQTINSSSGLHLLPSGPVPPFPAELLGSPRMKCLMEQWRREFDFILLDSPPLLPVTDSMVLNQFTDFHLLVVRFADPPKAAFRRAYNAVSEQAEPGTLGVIVNAFRQDSQEYEHYYGYSGYSYNSLSKKDSHERSN